MRPSKDNTWGDPKFRYDSDSPLKFDSSPEERPKVRSPRRDEIEQLLKDHSRKEILPVALQVPLAEIALRTRGLVGVVLGSTAKSLYSFKGDFESLNAHRDFDVLVLNPFTIQHPRPRMVYRLVGTSW